MRRLTLFFLSLAFGCGAAPPVTGSPRASVREALQAWSQLDAERAARLGEDAFIATGDRDAAEVSARAHLALGRWDAAETATRGAEDETLLRLRARAQIARGDHAMAAETLSPLVERPEPDPWAASVRPALLASPGYEVRGTGSQLPLRPLALPVVEVEVDAVQTLALVGTGVHLSVLDPAVRRQPGAIDELQIGELRVAHVPHTVRDLGAVSEALGVRIGMVLGADLLMRLGAILDGPAGTLTLSDAPPAPTPASAPLLSLTGSFLAVAATRGESRAWFTLDTSGLFPIAVSPSGGEALGLVESDWSNATDGPEMALVDLTLGTLPAEGIPVVRGLLAPRYAEAIGAPVSGSIGWLLLSQLQLRFDRSSRTLFFGDAAPSSAD
ncbi:MAG: hypothetical protein AB8I08_04790 [Sandaracinaceae bacterium]